MRIDQIIDYIETGLVNDFKFCSRKIRYLG